MLYSIIGRASRPAPLGPLTQQAVAATGAKLAYLIDNTCLQIGQGLDHATHRLYDYFDEVRIPHNFKGVIWFDVEGDNLANNKDNLVILMGLTKMRYRKAEVGVFLPAKNIEDYADILVPGVEHLVLFGYPKIDGTFDEDRRVAAIDMADRSTLLCRWPYYSGKPEPAPVPVTEEHQNIVQAFVQSEPRITDQIVWGSLGTTTREMTPEEDRMYADLTTHCAGIDPIE